MRRTAARPLPTGTLKPTEVLIFGAVTIVLGTAWLVLAVNLLAAMVALATSLSYLGLYTPLKTRTTLATAVGAIPGALPPLIGWAAARGSLSEGGWILFAILFVWQFPHFMAIAWMYREDYARAGIQMLPVVDPKGDATFRLIVGHVRGLGSGKPAAFRARDGRNSVFLRRSRAGNDFVASFAVGQSLAHQRPRQVVDACDRNSHSASAWLDDFR